MILTKDQRRSKKDKEQMRIKKSRYIKSDKTHCYTGKFNTALSLCRILEIVLHFSKGFSEKATKIL